MEEPFPELQNDLILRVIKGEKVERTPVWIMRQAGRYLPEFREIREQHSFFDMVRCPELVAQVTLQPILRYNFDAAIIFSDILIVCQAMGMEVVMLPEQGPVFKKPLRCPSDANELNEHVDVQHDLGYLMQAITLTRHKLQGRCPLIGFAGAPWTLMAYMTNTKVGSGTSRDFSQSRKWLYKHPEESHQLLGRISKVVAQLLIAQANAGAQMLMLFESHAEVLNHELFMKFSLSYLEQVLGSVRKSGITIPFIIFAKGAHHSLEALAQTGFDVITVDWSIDPENRLRNLPSSSSKTFMGNLDPAALYSDKCYIIERTRKMLKSFSGLKHICNLGHGIYPDVEPEAVATFVETVKQYKLYDDGPGKGMN